jgi:hypothetical protein
MTQSQANLVGGAVVGALFAAVAAGAFTAHEEVGQRTYTAPSVAAFGMEREQLRRSYPPGLALVAEVAGIGALLGLAVGGVAVAVPGLVLGRRWEKYLVDLIGLVGGAAAGACLGRAVCEPPFPGNFVWDDRLVAFGRGVGAGLGALQGYLVARGVRSLLARPIPSTPPPAPGAP